jgi:hypothetical protein
MRHPARGARLRLQIDGKPSAASRRREVACAPRALEEAAV